MHARFPLGVAHELLALVGSHRRDQAAADGELLEQRRRHRVRRGGQSGSRRTARAPASPRCHRHDENARCESSAPAASGARAPAAVRCARWCRSRSPAATARRSDSRIRFRSPAPSAPVPPPAMPRSCAPPHRAAKSFGRSLSAAPCPHRRESRAPRPRTDAAAHCGSGRARARRRYPALAAAAPAARGSGPRSCRCR